MEIEGTTTYRVASEIIGQAPNGFLRADVLKVPAVVRGGAWGDQSRAISDTERNFLVAEDIASLPPVKYNDLPFANDNQQDLVDTQVRWEPWPSS